MTTWTPDEVKQALDSRDRRAYEALVRAAVKAIEEGRARFFYSARARIDARSRSKDDDVDGVLERLLDRDARLLRKFGAIADFVATTDALHKYIVGVTRNLLLKQCSRPIREWQELDEDIDSRNEESAYLSGFAGLERALDVARALQRLPSGERELFRLLCDEQLDPQQICERLGISRPALDQRKSRMLKRLHELLNDAQERAPMEDRNV